MGCLGFRTTLSFFAKLNLAFEMKSEKLVELQPTYAANGNFWKTYGG
jgi:hypothetical protein